MMVSKRLYYVQMGNNMANKPIGSVMMPEIIRMKHKGISNSKISKSLGNSRTTIVKNVTAIVKSGIELRELLDVSDEDLLE